jgi:hypothetical protein
MGLFDLFNRSSNTVISNDGFRVLNKGFSYKIIGKLEGRVADGQEDEGGYTAVIEVKRHDVPLLNPAELNRSPGGGDIIITDIMKNNFLKSNYRYYMQNTFWKKSKSNDNIYEIHWHVWI